MAFFEISSIFIINPPLTMLHTSIVSYVWSNTNISNTPPMFWLIGHKSSGNCQNFIIYILHIVSMYSHIQIVHIVWLIGIKTNGNYRNFVIFTCFVLSIICYVYSNTKLILFPHWFGSLAVNARAIIEISIISHQLSAV